MKNLPTNYNWAANLPHRKEEEKSKVIVIASAVGGTCKTSLAAIFALAMSKLYSLKCLVVDASLTPALQYYLDVNYKIDLPSPQPTLDKLLVDISHLVEKRELVPSFDLTEYITHVENVDVLYSSYFPEANPQHFFILAELISKRNSDYDFVILDTRSGNIDSLLPLLSIADQILIPFRLGDWKTQLESLQYFEEFVAKLILMERPISVPHIIPIGQTRIHKKEYVALRSKLGNRVWPIYKLQPSKGIDAGKLIKNFNKHKDILLEFFMLSREKPGKRNASTLIRYRAIWEMVSQSQDLPKKFVTTKMVFRIRGKMRMLFNRRGEDNFVKQQRKRPSHGEIANKLNLVRYLWNGKRNITAKTVGHDLHDFTMLSNWLGKAVEAEFRSLCRAKWPKRRKPIVKWRAINSKYISSHKTSRK